MPAPVLINCQNLTKAFGERPLFVDLSFGLHEGDRVGLIGPNGAGKSTFLKILAEEVEADDGLCTRRKGLRVGYVPQRPAFDAARTVSEVVTQAAGRDDHTTGVALSRCGFADPTVLAETLSGGWKTRLAVACALAQEPGRVPTR